ncbi:PREDICTED: uncharacterized protein LOC108364469 [Rhagoletis zephyria]|uniref:uncharacterized protein LOC108364469 n=1 Tax=Rhagoletis zephyria TaxID=28612 RepID=UPI00081178E8|nr:PREDICTED: uncharacterized protein LOC108364469 [Rhagoletis zephyria]XP_017473644.1 PREDICTED: uncharacterized protein LOC108364469 [Rhagoletis zephyria]XP_017473645.1 PREDICTED: uncharacterized protein LOC108364469 [Rhagoletis zephyria]XP_036317516.1 uncharacterized protein LOC118732497 [Rhagoletis pomonella]XP_036317517.1 uncharacterized protein LOC118732497 [Rhagoletis pomonella]XP_036317518.1 uncharacterized protein LOC118732497 [Rhagoletis pomonella]XP_036317519.1 uncharacterized prot
MDSNIRKSRLPNFTSAEETLLISLAEQHAMILENKRTDAVFCEEKKKVWEKIDVAFEAQMGVKRGPKNLREKYENLKRKARKSLAEERREMYKTGGGQFRSYTDSNTDRLAALMGQSATGLSNSFDSDVITYEIETIAENDAVPEILEDSMRSYTAEPVEATEAVENDITTDWSAWNPTLLKKKKSEKLAVKNEKGKQKFDHQQAFWEDENKRAAERHQWAKKKHELEISEAEMKLELLQIDMKLKNRQSESQCT